MNKIEFFIYNNRYIILILGMVLETIRYILKKSMPGCAKNLVNYYRLSICIWVILLIIWCVLQKEYILVIFIPIFALAVVYYLKEIIREFKRKKIKHKK